MIGLSDYAKIHNNYCICYFGYADEYLIQLGLLRPFLERSFPGLNIYLGCKDSCKHFLQGYERILTLSDIKVRKPEFAHIVELVYNGEEHPIDKFVTEAGISQFTIQPTSSPSTSNVCVIVNEGAFPTVPMIERQVQIVKRYARERGLEPVVGGPVETAGLVIGVESPGLFRAAALGLPTALVPTGVGTSLYKKMFPNGEILRV